MKNVIKKYTFDNYITEENWQKYLKEKALKFIDENDKWFFIGGQSGSGNSTRELKPSSGRKTAFSTNGAGT